MKARDPLACRRLPRSRSARVAIMATAVLISGCTLFPASPGRAWYQLEDARAAARGQGSEATATTAKRKGAETPDTANAAPSGAVSGLTLVLTPLQANALYDGTGIVHGRATGLRSTYQYANWTERPSRRLVELLDARLNARDADLRRFATVATEASGVKADWVLGLRIVEFFHDTSSDPDRAIVDIDAELVDWRSKSLIDRRRFRIEQPLPSEDVEGAVDALGRASSTLLDRLVAWLDAKAARSASDPR